MTFELEERLFDLRAEFGSDPAHERLVAEVNDILRTLSVGEYREVPDALCREEVGFGDPDCPEPRWVRRLLEHAGYRLARDKGGPFVARGAETEFFIIAEELPEEPSYELGHLAFPKRENVHGVTVFGGDTEWRWRVQGVEVRLAEGPHGDSIFPTLAQVEPLVAASAEIPYEG